MFQFSSKTCFLRERHEILFFGVFCVNRQLDNISNLWPKPWTNPFGKMQILRIFKTDVFGVFCVDRQVDNISNFGPKPWTFQKVFQNLWKNANSANFLNRCFHSPKSLVFSIKVKKILFSQSILTVYYIGIQGITGGYKGLQGVTRGYKRLHEVTRGYNGVHEVTRGYGGL